jgi:hypothetical protein
MDIGGTRRIDGARPARAARVSASDGKGFAAEETAEAKTAAALTGTGPIAAVDTILALQGIDDWADQKTRGTRHGEQLLHLLDEVRDGLLAGGIPRATLSRLAQAVSKRRDSFADASLSSILDEIELRARVELAKLEQADVPIRRTV